MKIEKFKKEVRKNERGFTILESVVAIFIISLAISGVFTAVQRSLSQTIVAKDEVTAFYLAQEAIEIIKNKRDSNQLVKIFSNSSATWLDGITSSCPFNNICSVDATNLSISNCGASWGSCSNLRQNGSTNLYNYSTGPTTNFKREIQIESVSSNEIMVTVQVTWSKGGISRSFKAKTHLFNWVSS